MQHCDAVSRVARMQLLRSLHGRLCTTHAIGMCSVLRHEVRYRIRGITTDNTMGIHPTISSSSEMSTLSEDPTTMAADGVDAEAHAAEDNVDENACAAAIVRLCTATVSTSASLQVRAYDWGGNSQCIQLNASDNQNSVLGVSPAGETTHHKMRKEEGEKMLPAHERVGDSGADEPSSTRTQMPTPASTMSSTLEPFGHSTISTRNRFHNQRLPVDASPAPSNSFDSSCRNVGRYLQFFRAQHEMLDVVLASAYHTAVVAQHPHTHGTPPTATPPGLTKMHTTAPADKTPVRAMRSGVTAQSPARAFHRNPLETSSPGLGHADRGCHAIALLSGSRAVGLRECATLYAHLRGTVLTRTIWT